MYINFLRFAFFWHSIICTNPGTQFFISFRRKKMLEKKVTRHGIFLDFQIIEKQRGSWLRRLIGVEVKKGLKERGDFSR